MEIVKTENYISNAGRHMSFGIFAYFHCKSDYSLLDRSEGEGVSAAGTMTPASPTVQQAQSSDWNKDKN